MELKFVSGKHMRGSVSQEKEYGLVLVAGAVQVLVAAELLLHAVLGILAGQFELWQVDALSYGRIQCMLVISVLLFGIIAPLCGKYRVLAYAGFEAGLLAFGGWYGWKYFDRIRDGVIALCGDYLLAWNAYYRTNYIVEYDSLELGYSLGILVLVSVLLFLILRYVTGVRFLMLVPPLAALSLGLLVDKLADWRGLACLFAGALVLCSGAGEPSGIVFAPLERGAAAKHRMAPFLPVLCALAAAVVILFAAYGLFRVPAERVPEKTPEFLAFQNRLENTLLSLGNGVHIPSDRQRLDNATPYYSNEVMFTITADQTPFSNLYLPEFYSGTYQNGSWRQQKRAYRSAAADNGFDGDHLGTLLWQMGYEYLHMVPILQISGQKPELTRKYTIDYGEKRTTSAWVPYFADLNSLQDQVWVEDEGLVKKKWASKELSFTGWGGNTELLNDFAGSSFLEDGDSDTSAVDWYSDYVREHYQGKSGISAVQEYARAQKDSWQWLEATGIYWSYWEQRENDIVRIGDRLVYGQELRDAADSKEPYYRGEDAVNTNLYRLAVAEAVQKQLAAEADYNLYLSDIPAGTDTVQYFLEAGREGYCMHFASAGTLILQELGIPARYASGYIVKRNSFHSDSEKGVTAKVYDRNAHAWAEVYLENIGWVPVEMTPGYETEGDELPTDGNRQAALIQQHEQRAQQQENSEERKPKKELSRQDSTEEDSEEAAEGTEETDDTENAANREEESSEDASGLSDAGRGSGGGTDTGIPWKRAAGYAGLAALVLLAVLAAAAAVRYGRRRYRDALGLEIQRKQNRRAVMRMNRRIYRRLQGGGILPMGRIRLPGQAGGREKIQWLGLTDAEYERKLARAYTSVRPHEWAEYMRIVKKAAFSGEEILPQELQYCYHIYQTHRKTAK